MKLETFKKQETLPMLDGWGTGQKEPMDDSKKFTL